ncbi:MAG: type I-MYXAN CRISPR-associated protein Cas6/Cmx6 [Gammaproteobacteria bacterium]|nr:type I-MYXAN CRISPR-associated protein Cas6/Cmx6 [Gammaproteobacteria bacterium]
MSLWQDDPKLEAPVAQAVDVVFRIQCKQLPVDHAEPLASSLLTIAPWMENLPYVGIHSVHVAGSQNGWERPDDSLGERLMLSKRTRLRIRMPLSHADQLVDALSHSQLSISGEPMAILSGTVRPFEPITNLFARSCHFGKPADPELDESEFTQKVVSHCLEIGFSPNKILCGKSRTIYCGEGPIYGRSVLIADIPPQYSLKLQEVGIGSGQLLGCGILLPHKDTAAVS